LDLDDGAALALVVGVVFEAVVDALGSVLVSEPQPDSMIATAAAIAAVPVIAARFTN
jgi:hypothetical protein